MSLPKAQSSNTEVLHDKLYHLANEWIQQVQSNTVSTAASLTYKNASKPSWRFFITTLLFMAFGMTLTYVLPMPLAVVACVGLSFASFKLWNNYIMKMARFALDGLMRLQYRKDALRPHESCEWVNFALSRWWMFSVRSLASTIQHNINYQLGMTDLKHYADYVRMDTLEMGEGVPQATRLMVYEMDPETNAMKPAAWYNIDAVPDVLQHTQAHALVFDMEAGWHSEKFKLTCVTKPAMLPFDVTIVVNGLTIQGKLRVILKLDRNAAFPHIASLAISFVEEPNIDFSLSVFNFFNSVEVPGVQGYIQEQVRKAALSFIVDPEQIVIPLSAEALGDFGANKIPEVIAVLIVTIEVKKRRNTSKAKDGWITLRLAERTLVTEPLAPLVSSMGEEESRKLRFAMCVFTLDSNLKVESKQKRYLLPPLTSASLEIPVEPLSKNGDPKVTFDNNRLSVKTDLQLEYIKVEPVVAARKYFSANKPDISETAGLLHLKIVSASLTVPKDFSNSDPYCVVLVNGRNVGKTKRIDNTMEPAWDHNIECLLSGSNRALITLQVFDYDGPVSALDDFHGAATMIYHFSDGPLDKVELDLIDEKQPEPGAMPNKNYGHVVLSAMFRPIPDMRKCVTTIPPYTVAESEMLMNDAVRKKLRKTFTAGGVDTIMNADVVDINIIKASELLPMDNNGLSDPFCKIKYNGAQLYTTKYKKETLAPVWNETFTVPKPSKLNDTVTVEVWDHDTIGSNDYIGSVQFSSATVEEILGKELQHKLLGDGQMHAGLITLAFQKRGLTDSHRITADSGFKYINSSRLDFRLQIRSANNLMLSKSGKPPNAFCKIKLNSEQVFQTVMIFDTIKPMWDQSHELTISPEDTVSILVFNKSYSEEFMGSIELQAYYIEDVLNKTPGAKIPMPLRHVTKDMSQHQSVWKSGELIFSIKKARKMSASSDSLPPTSQIPRNSSVGGNIKKFLRGPLRKAHTVDYSTSPQMSRSLSAQGLPTPSPIESARSFASDRSQPLEIDEDAEIDIVDEEVEVALQMENSQQLAAASVPPQEEIPAVLRHRSKVDQLLEGSATSSVGADPGDSPRAGLSR